MATFRCPHCGGTDVETRAWVKYKNDQFVFPISVKRVGRAGIANGKTLMLLWRGSDENSHR